MLVTVLILEIHQGTKETKLPSLLGFAFWELEAESKPSKLESILESERKNKFKKQGIGDVRGEFQLRMEWSGNLTGKATFG